MPEANASVLIIDDDPEFRDSVVRLLRTVGLDTRQFSSVSDFLTADVPDGPTCLVLDVRFTGAKRSRASARARCSEQATPNHLHHSARRHSDDCASDEGWCH